MYNGKSDDAAHAVELVASSRVLDFRCTRAHADLMRCHWRIQQHQFGRARLSCCPDPCLEKNIPGRALKDWAHMMNMLQHPSRHRQSAQFTTLVGAPSKTFVSTRHHELTQGTQSKGRRFCAGAHACQGISAVWAYLCCRFLQTCVSSRHKSISRAMRRPVSLCNCSRFPFPGDACPKKFANTCLESSSSCSLPRQAC